MGIALLVKKCIDKTSQIYRKRVVAEYTHSDVSTLRILGSVDIVNPNVKFGKNVILFNNITIFGDGPVEIGDYTCIGANTLIYGSASGGVKIGAHTQIAALSYIIDTDHGTNAGTLIQNQPNTVAPIEIGNDVWIAAGAKILKGSIISDGAIVGAQSVVKGYVPSNAIVAGVPAKIIKYREDDNNE